MTEVREVERLYLDTIAAARRWLYIENQYLTATVSAMPWPNAFASPRDPRLSS